LATGRRALHKKAEVERRLRTKSAAWGKSTKFDRLLKNIQLHGDVSKAAGSVRMSKKQLGELMNDPVARDQINRARMVAITAEHAGELLFNAKVAPQIAQDAEFFAATGQRHRESRVIAKFAAGDLKGFKWEITEAANNNDKGFFTDLGKILAGELSGELYDPLDGAIMEVFKEHPTASTYYALAELQERGFAIEAGALRQRKTRLGLTRSRDSNL